MTRSRVQDRDRGYKALLKRLKNSRGEPRLTVGIHDEEGSKVHGDDGVTISDIAAFHEFGTASIPARPFISGWADENREQNMSDLRKMAQAVIKGKVPSVHVALERLGAKFVGDIQKRIKAGIAPPLSQVTIDRKGSSTPLIDKGQLWGSITHKVDEKK